MPVIIATMRAMKRLNRFLNIVTLTPKYFFSKGKVTKPTIINVVVNAERTVHVTPFLSKMPQRGKAMKPGIRVMEPKKDAIITPLDMLLFPK